MAGYTTNTYRGTRTVTQFYKYTTTLLSEDINYCLKNGFARDDPTHKLRMAREETPFGQLLHSLGRVTVMFSYLHFSHITKLQASLLKC